MRWLWIIIVLVPLRLCAVDYSQCVLGGFTAGTHTTIAYTFSAGPHSGQTIHITGTCGIPNNAAETGACLIGDTGNYPGSFSTSNPITTAGVRGNCMNTYALSSGSDTPCFTAGNRIMTTIAGGGGIFLNSYAIGGMIDNGPVPATIPNFLADGYDCVTEINYPLNTVGYLYSASPSTVTAGATSIQVNAYSGFYWWPSSSAPNYVLVMCDNLPGTACEQMLVTACTAGCGSIGGGSTWGPLSLTVTRQYKVGGGSTPSQTHGAGPQGTGFPVWVMDTNGAGAWGGSTYKPTTNDLTGPAMATPQKSVMCYARWLNMQGVKSTDCFGGSQGAYQCEMWDLLANANFTDSTCNDISQQATAPIRPTWKGYGSLPSDYASPALKCYYEGATCSNLETQAVAAMLGPGYPGHLDGGDGAGSNSSAAWGAGIVHTGVCPSGFTGVGNNCPGVSCACFPTPDASGIQAVSPTAAYTAEMGAGPRGCTDPQFTCMSQKLSTPFAPNAPHSSLDLSGIADTAIWPPMQPAYYAQRGIGIQTQVNMVHTGDPVNGNKCSVNDAGHTDASILYCQALNSTFGNVPQTVDPSFGRLKVGSAGISGGVSTQ